MAHYSNLTEVQVKLISSEINTAVDIKTLSSILKAVDHALGDRATTAVATTAAAGLVEQGAAVADATVAIDGTSAGTQLNALLASLRSAGIISV